MRLRDQVEVLPRWAIYLISYSILAIVVYFNFVSEPGFSMDLFYLVPIYFLTWFGGIAPGIVMAFLCMVSLVAADLHWHLPLFTSPELGWDHVARFCFLFITTVLLGRLREAYRSASESSRSDFLTGLANRREFFAVAEQERLRAARYGKSVSVAYMDLDGFKEINDQLGHSAGDTILMDVANELRNNLRATDVVARMGGDEFVILLPETDAAAAKAKIEQLRELLLVLARQRNWPVTYSIGLVTFLHPPKSTDEMIGEADHLMYAVKRGTKNNLATGTWPHEKS
ncbi:MAG: GGDEF domain-containing protein [Terriglobia bacterium]|jgi:diguanylate cyclase (GGDEF)-like protein|nr:GGDEF domain-containing protein [Terriglobia bacterium]